MRVLRTLLRWVLVLGVVALLVVGGMALVKRKQHALAGAPKYGLGPVPVRVAVARVSDLPIELDYLGVIEPVRVANVSARLTATVERVLVDEGDRVEAGDTLVVLDDREIRDDIAAAEARIEQARADLAGNEATIESLAESLAYWRRQAERDAKLAAEHDIPAADAEATADKVNGFAGRLRAAQRKADAIRHLIDSLEKREAQLKTRAGYCCLTSPYEGVVSRRDVDPGDLAAPGKTLLVVEDRRRLKIAVNVPQRDVPHLKPGLAVRFETPDGRRSAAITDVFPSLDRARMLRAEIALSGEQAAGLTCGAYVPLSVTLRTLENIVLLPGSALIERPQGGTYVFVVNDDRLAPRPVKVLGTSGDAAAVTGIDPGARVVTNTFLGWATLSAGIKVEVLQ